MNLPQQMEQIYNSFDHSNGPFKISVRSFNYVWTVRSFTGQNVLIGGPAIYDHAPLYLST